MKPELASPVVIGLQRAPRIIETPIGKSIHGQKPMRKQRASPDNQTKGYKPPQIPLGSPELAAPNKQQNANPAKSMGRNKWESKLFEK